jgi:hypothetical protein
MEIFLPFYIVSSFTRKKFLNINKFIVKCEGKMLNEGNQIHNFISSSGSTSQKVTLATVPVPVRVPVPQHWMGGGGGCGVSANEFSCVHHVTWSPNKLWRSYSIFNLYG